MKSLNFALKIDVEPVIIVASHHVVEISIKDESLGFIYIALGEKDASCVIPFTHLGEMKAVDCFQCALKMLFAERAFLRVDQIDIAEDVQSTDLKSVLIEAVSKASKNKVH
ncbi:hypothetical protein CHU32_03790 [Superficieibacter electus]|uniref:Uncharacterized protein n=1 Tax=Superficieibacter electus TaxID=2022662 RepID=A0A2P5GVG5_9ENTR|nr:hypothetical protein [Superficieibacter electus]POP42366.1 hypothetical protein CHU33_20075 [Superficieibacter electus]POP50555.1 hypothetical protein CHU32_03790 [Superficieibacter electus]